MHYFSSPSFSSLCFIVALFFCTSFSYALDVSESEEIVTESIELNEIVAEHEKLANEYQLTAGDKINVYVLGQEDLSLEVQISDTNTIIFPLIGEMNVANLTRQQTEKLIHDELKGDYLVNPEVSVSISSYRQIYVQGEVKSPGPYPYTPGLSLRRAILNAGGFTETASKGKIYVVNEFDSDAEQKKVNLGYQLEPGDIITVRASFF